MIILIVTTLGILNIAGFLMLVKMTGTRTEYDFYSEIKKQTEAKL